MREIAEIDLEMTVLTQREIVPYLIRSGLFSERSVIGGSVVVVEASRRNCNFKAISAHDGGYLLKQGTTAGGITSVAHEAEVYSLLQRVAHGEARRDSKGPQVRLARSCRRRSELVAFIPHCCFYDPAECVLVIELVPQAESLHEYHQRIGRFPATLASEMGENLCTLHTLAIDVDTEGNPDRRLQLPWALSLHRPHVQMLLEISAANLELIQLLQGSEELCLRLDALRDDWQATSFIHSDLKWDNCVVAPHIVKGSRRVKVVDWEFAAIGDPDWDVGSIFAAYLGFWLQSIPFTPEDPVTSQIDSARYPLDKMRPAMWAFWRSYVRSVGLAPQEAARRLLRATKYCAARLIQSGFEQLQASPQLTGIVVRMVQLASNILQQPHVATVHLLGFPLENVGMQ